MLYFRQLLPGRDIAILDEDSVDALSEQELQERELLYQLAITMQNYVYLIGDTSTGECFVVDGCWDVKGIEEQARKDGMRIVGAIATHYHFDHIGGHLPKPWSEWIKMHIPGLKELAELTTGNTRRDDNDKRENQAAPAPVYIHEIELQKASQQAGLGEEKFRCLRDGSKLSLSGGKVHLSFIHTPGHSPGGLCILVTTKYERKNKLGGHANATRENESFLLSGDTVFPGSCGRFDLPDSDALAMYNSLQHKLSGLPDELRIYPGHAYNGAYSTIGQEKQSGIMTPISKELWLRKVPAPKPNL